MFRDNMNVRNLLSNAQFPAVKKEFILFPCSATRANTSDNRERTETEFKDYCLQDGGWGGD